MTTPTPFTDYVSHYNSNTTDAQFRTRQKAVSDAIVACGFPKTTDTGQIDWATVLRPTAPNTFVGYEIFRWADADQATNPIFLKITYGSSPQSSGWGLALKMQLGTGTDGAGNLTGVKSQEQAWGGQSASNGYGAGAGSVLRFWGDATKGQLVMCCHNTSTTPNSGSRSNEFLISMERVKAVDGTEIGNFSMTVCFITDNGIGVADCTVDRASGLMINAANFPIWIPASVATTAIVAGGNNIVTLFPLMTFDGRRRADRRNIYGYLNADIAPLGTFQAELDGVQRTLFATGDAQGFGAGISYGNTGLRGIAYLYD